jgi:glycosyltransferase involved in cell wall biosynthesis
MSDANPTIGIVVPCFNEAEGIADFHASLKSAADKIEDAAFQFLFVNDGSRDQTAAVLQRIIKSNPSSSMISLSRNFGHQAALRAGLDTLDGRVDAVVIMDGDGQHPPAMLQTMVDAWRNGADIVSMQRASTHKNGLFKRLSSQIYYRGLSRLADIEITPSVADFGLFSRKALREICRFREQDLFLRGAVAWLGFNRVLIPFEALERKHGTTRYTLRKMVRLAESGLFGFSTTPIKLTAKMGMWFVAASLIYLAYAMVQLLSNGTVQGWTSLLATVVFFGGMNLISIGVIGLYVARICDDVRARPLYMIADGAGTFGEMRMAQDLIKQSA